MTKNKPETKNKKHKVALSHKIMIVFVATSLSILLSGFVIQSQLFSRQANAWRGIASYYFYQNQDLQEELNATQTEKDTTESEINTEDQQ